MKICPSLTYTSLEMGRDKLNALNFSLEIHKNSESKLNLTKSSIFKAVLCKEFILSQHKVIKSILFFSMINYISVIIIILKNHIAVFL